MKKGSSLLVVVASIFLLVCGVTAQQTISETKKALIRELNDVTGAKRNTDQMLQTMLTFQRAQSAKMLESSINDDKSIPLEEKKERLEKAKAESERMAKRLTDYITREFNIGAVMEDISYTVYDKYFTEDELKDLISFYKSPAGKKYISVVPNVIADSMSIFVEKYAPKLDEFVKKVVDEELTQINRETTQPTPKPR